MELIALSYCTHYVVVSFRSRLQALNKCYVTYVLSDNACDRVVLVKKQDN